MTESQQPNSFRLGKSEKARVLPGYLVDDRWEVLELVGDGSFSSVYKCRDRDGSIVAVKLLHTSLITDYDEIVRLKKEARVLSGIQCPNVAMYYHFGLIEGKIPYVVTEFLDGYSLREVIDTQSGEPLGAGIAVLVGLAVSDALIAVHSATLVHGDLKPSNIMVVVDESEGEQIKVTNFGLARSLANSEDSLTHNLTETGMLTGSVAYMSPERCMGKQPDAKSDIYSLGCILYEIVMGRPPFFARDPVEVVRQQLSDEMPLLNAGKSPMEQELLPIIRRAMSKDRSQRFDDAAQLKDALAVLTESAEFSPAEIRLTPIKRPSTPKLTPLALGLAAAALIGALLWIGTQFH